VYNLDSASLCQRIVIPVRTSREAQYEDIERNIMSLQGISLMLLTLGW